MKSNLTELVFILDRSGSMTGLESDTIGGFNSMLAKQIQEAGDANITTVLFDDRYELLHDRINIKGVSQITDREYFVRGCTALLDAIGKTISKIVNVQQQTSDDLKAKKVMFVIITDGLENSSREYSADKVRRMVENQKSKYGWEFIFLGANIDAIETASNFGISQDHAVNFNADKMGVQLNYLSINKVISTVRSGGKISRDWKSEIEKDFEERRRKS